MGEHTLSAFFDSRGEAEAAFEALRELGLSDANVTVVGGDAAAAGAGPASSPSFLGFLNEFFGGSREMGTYHEGLRRGAVMVTARVGDGQLESASDALNANGAIDLDERQRGWAADGWEGPSAAALDATAGFAPPAMGVVTGQPYTQVPRASGALGEDAWSWPARDTDPAPRRDGSGAASSLGRVRVHSDSFGDSAGASRLAGASPDERILPGMEVVGADGRHIGTVDRIDAFNIKLKRADPGLADPHHLIPLDWVQGVAGQVTLSKAAHDAMRQWQEA